MNTHFLNLMLTKLHTRPLAKTVPQALKRLMPLLMGKLLTPMTLTLVLTLILTTAGCAHFVPVEPQAKPASAAAIGMTSVAIQWPADRWWQSYGVAELNTLIEQALSQAPGLKIAEARMRRAAADAGLVESTSKVQMIGVIDSTYERFSKNGIVPPPYGGTRQSLNNANVNISLAIDFFGRNRALLDAAIGQVAASKADAQSARVILAASVAKTYFNLARLFAQRKLANESLSLREQTRQLVQQRVTNGLDTNVDLRQAESNLPGTRLEIAQLDEQIALARNQLAVLIGVAPDATKSIAPLFITTRDLSLPASIPADLLGRRADIAAAKARVEAATRSIDATRAAFYPNINLVAFVGFGSIGLSHWIDAGSAQYGIGPAITIPIFAGGRLRATLAANTADYDAAVETYNQILLEAVRDVADQISSTQSVTVQLTEQRDAQAAVEAAYLLVKKRYQAGLTNYLVVLTAENTVLAQRRQATELKARVLDLNINLNRALGGGYLGDALPATSAQP